MYYIGASRFSLSGASRKVEGSIIYIFQGGFINEKTSRTLQADRSKRLFCFSQLSLYEKCNRMKNLALFVTGFVVAATRHKIELNKFNS